MTSDNPAVLGMPAQPSVGARLRAWRFFHPDLDASSGGGGLAIGPGGGIAFVEQHAAVRQGLLLLFSTRPGERVMRPTYGCDLYKLIYSPLDGTTAGLAIHFVRQAVQRWEPRVAIVRVDAGPHPDRPEALAISLEYRVRTTGHPEQLAFAMDLTGEPA